MKRKKPTGFAKQILATSLAVALVVTPAIVSPQITSAADAPQDIPHRIMFHDNDTRDGWIQGEVSIWIPDDESDIDRYDVYVLDATGAKATALDGQPLPAIASINKGDNIAGVATASIGPIALSDNTLSLGVFAVNAFGESVNHVDVKIIDVPDNVVSSIKFVDRDNDVGQISGKVTFTPQVDTSTFSAYTLAFLSPSNEPLGALAPISADKRHFVIPPNTTVPNGATKLAIHLNDSNNLMTEHYVTTDLVDVTEQTYPVWPEGPQIGISNLTNTSFTISWPSVTTEIPADSYNIYVDGALTGTVPSDVTTYNIEDLTTGTYANVAVEAVAGTLVTNDGPSSRVLVAAEQQIRNRQASVDFRLPAGVDYTGTKVKIFDTATVPASTTEPIAEYTYGVDSDPSEGLVVRPITGHDGNKYISIFALLYNGSYSLEISSPSIVTHKIENIVFDDLSIPMRNLTPENSPRYTFDIEGHPIGDMPYISLQRYVVPTTPTVPTPPTTPTTPPTTPVTEGSIIFPSTGINIVTQTDGTVVANIGAVELKNFLTKPSNNISNLIIPIDSTGTKTVVNLPTNIITDLPTEIREVRRGIAFTLKDMGYTLPLSVINKKYIDALLGEDKGDDSQISLTITEIPKDIIKDPSIKLVSKIIDFDLSIVVKDKKIEFNNFGNTFIDRTITLDKKVDPSKTVGVMINKDGVLSPIPTNIKERDGIQLVTLKRNGNSMYAVIENTKTFSDVENHWAKENIELLASKLIVEGKTGTSFDPQANITRAEFAQILVRALGLSLVEPSSDFIDVEGSAWYSSAIATATSAGLVKGYEDKTFRPNVHITREQMAVMTQNALEFAGKNQIQTLQYIDYSQVFTDYVNVSDWAKDSVERLLKVDLIRGVGDSKLAPGKTATRAEAVTILTNAFEFADFITR